MAKRRRPTSELGEISQPLSDQELAGVNGGLDMAAALGGPDTRKGVTRTIGAMETITVGAAQS